MPNRDDLLRAALCLAAACAAGCGSTKGRVATEQLLASDAVDQAVSRIDFRPLAGRMVYLDTQYLKPSSRSTRSIGFVDENYVTSSLRQQMIACGCLLQDTKDQADIVVEARMGTLGTDSREIVYGLPASNAISAAASAASALSPTTPNIPAIPEISIARRDDQLAAAKIAAFAYERETRQPVWQSGLAVARSNAKDSYFLGAGPFQRGTIYEGVRYTGGAVNPKHQPGGESSVALTEPHIFDSEDDAPEEPVSEPTVLPAGHTTDAE